MISLNTRIALWLIVIAPLGAAQFDDRLWLVQAGAAGPGRVFECDRAGNVLGQYSGPQFGSGGVLKDLFLGRVWVCDDGAWNGVGRATGAIRAYEAGVGETMSFMLPGARAISMLSGGDMAVLINENPLQPSRVQVLSWNAPTSLAPAVTVGLNALQLVSAPGDVLWTLDSLSRTVTRISGSSTTTISPTTSSAALGQLVLLPGGQILVTFQGQAVASILSSDGLSEWAFMLPEPVLRIVADGDMSVFLLGVSGTMYRINTKTAEIVDQFSIPTGTPGGLIPAQGGRVWVEDVSSATATLYGFGGVTVASAVLPVATHTRGDPLGLEWAGKTQPDADVDGDGMPTGLEIRQGTDALDGADIPPGLASVGSFGGVIPLVIHAPGRGNRPFILLASLSGARPQPLGPDGHSAPYFALNVGEDLLTQAMIWNTTVSSHFLGMPLGELDASGTAFAAVDLSAFNGFPGFVSIYCAAVVFEPGFNEVSATTNPVCFDNTGAICH